MSHGRVRDDYRTQVLDDLAGVAADDWNALAAAGAGRASAQPFLRHEFLRALELAGFRGTCCCATRPVRRPRPFRPT